MGDQLPMQAVVLDGATANGNLRSVELALVNPDGTAAGTVKKAAAQADTTAADLAALKVDFNLLLAKLRTARVIAP